MLPHYPELSTGQLSLNLFSILSYLLINIFSYRFPGEDKATDGNTAGGKVRRKPKI